MELSYACRYQGCHITFDHRQKRIRHEKTHARAHHQIKKTSLECDCCKPPRSFAMAE